MAKFKYAFDDNKRYHTWNYYLRNNFGEKVFKVSLNAGFTCPNLDGKVSKGGCTYCSNSGSGDFAGNPASPLSEQFAEIKAMMHKKWPNAKYIAYFQAYTNTYAPLNVLKDKFEEALSFENVIGLSISTRPDCLEDDVVDYLAELNERTNLWVELGLQTMHERTAAYIRRGYPLSCFEDAVQNLRMRQIEVIVHTILGLPGESEKDILETMQYLNGQDIQGIKLQLLHVLKGTDLAEDYVAGKFRVYEREEYLNLLIDCLEHLDPSIVIHRMTGDGPEKLLIAPLWASRKREVLNLLHHEMKVRNSWQGKQLQ